MNVCEALVSYIWSKYFCRNFKRKYFHFSVCNCCSSYGRKLCEKKTYLLRIVKLMVAVFSVTKSGVKFPLAVVFILVKGNLSARSFHVRCPWFLFITIEYQSGKSPRRRGNKDIFTLSMLLSNTIGLNPCGSLRFLNNSVIVVLIGILTSVPENVKGHQFIVFASIQKLFNDVPIVCKPFPETFF